MTHFETVDDLLSEPCSELMRTPVRAEIDRLMGMGMQHVVGSVASLAKGERLNTHERDLLKQASGYYLGHNYQAAPDPCEVAWLTWCRASGPIDYGDLKGIWDAAWAACLQHVGTVGL